MLEDLLISLGFCKDSDSRLDKGLCILPRLFASEAIAPRPLFEGRCVRASDDLVLRSAQMLGHSASMIMKLSKEKLEKQQAFCSN